jgi:hypothetical protein
VTLAEFAPSFLLRDNKHVAGIIPRSDGSGAYGGGTYDILGPTLSQRPTSYVLGRPYSLGRLRLSYRHYIAAPFGCQPNSETHCERAPWPISERDG